MAPRTLLLGALLSVAVPLTAAEEIDPTTGLVIAEHWETVRNNCIA